MCLYPTIGENKKYKKNKKNGGIIPPVFDERIRYVAYGCGNCVECRRQYGRDWQIRLSEEIKRGKGIFVTLTLSNESVAELIKAAREKTEKKIYETYANGQKELWKRSYEIEKLESKLTGYGLDNEVATVAVRRWLERYRKEKEISLRHWLVTELGHNGTENIHLHGIIWGEENLEVIKDTWKYGYVYPRNEREKTKNFVGAKTVNYIIKYITKIDSKHKEYKGIVLASAGIGNNWLESMAAKDARFRGKDTKDWYVTSKGRNIGLPIYYRNKLYSETEREKLWTYKLDKEVRYVLRTEISIAEGEEQYFRYLKAAQETNNRLGYGNNIKNWERVKYEEERRRMMQETRIKNAGKDRTRYAR